MTAVRVGDVKRPTAEGNQQHSDDNLQFPLLEKMIEADLLRNVDCFMIQFHEWHPGAYGRRKKIQKELSKTHRLLWDYHFVWEKWVLL